MSRFCSKQDLMVSPEFKWLRIGSSRDLLRNLNSMNGWEFLEELSEYQLHAASSL